MLGAYNKNTAASIAAKRNMTPAVFLSASVHLSLWLICKTRPHNSINMSNICTGLLLQITNTFSFSLRTRLSIKSTCSTDCLRKSPLNMTSVWSTDASFSQVFRILWGPGAIFHSGGFTLFCRFFRWGLWQKQRFYFDTRGIVICRNNGAIV